MSVPLGATVRGRAVHSDTRRSRPRRLMAEIHDCLDNRAEFLAELSRLLRADDSANRDRSLPRLPSR